MDDAYYNIRFWLRKSPCTFVFSEKNTLCVTKHKKTKIAREGTGRCHFRDVGIYTQLHVKSRRGRLNALCGHLRPEKW